MSRHGRCGVVLAACSLSSRRLLGCGVEPRRPAPPRALRVQPRRPARLPSGAGAIEHATGATDVILRLDQGAGFLTPAVAPPRRRPSRSTATAPSSSATRWRSARRRSATSSFKPVADRQLDRGPDPGDPRAARSARAASASHARSTRTRARGRRDGDLHDPRGRAREDGHRLRARHRRPEHAGPAGPRRIHEALRAADRLRPERHVRDGVYVPARTAGSCGRRPGRARPAWPWADITPADFVGDGRPEWLSCPPAS